MSWSSVVERMRGFPFVLRESEEPRTHAAWSPAPSLLARNARYSLSSCVRLSVRPSQAGIVSKRLDESSWFSEWRLPSIYSTLCYKEIWVSPKIKVFPLGVCRKLRTQRKFRHGKSIVLSTKLVVVVDGRVRWRHLYDDRRVAAIYYKSVNCNVNLFNSITSICCSTSFYSWQVFSTGMACGAVRLR